MNGTLEVSQPTAAPPVQRVSARRVVLRTAAGLVVTAVTLGWLLPRTLGTSAHEIIAAFGGVSVTDLVGLGALWAAGLLVHSFVLTGALPGLTRGRALTLNLTGSAVSNLVPLGGALGITLNYRMLRSWRVSTTEFASYTLVSNIWVVLTKLAMPAVAVALALVVGGGGVVGHRVGLPASLGAAALGGVVLGVLAVLRSRRMAARLATLLARIAGGRPFRGRVASDAVVANVLATRDEVVSVVRRRWPRLTLAMTGYGLLQAALLFGCLEVVGAGVTFVVAFAGWAVERLLTLVCLTPAGAGVAEAGAAGLLVAGGAEPAAVAAGVFLYRGFVAALEIPVGGTWLAAWWVGERRRQVSRHRALAPEPV